SGQLPLAELTVPGQEVPAYVRCQLEVVTPGNFGFQLDDVRGVTLWLDGKSIAPMTKLTLELPRGMHTFVFRVDPRTRNEASLRWELVQGAGSKGQAKFMDGR